MEVKVKDRQSLADIALRTSGSMEAAFRLASANDVSLTDTLQDGQALDAAPVESAETVRRYNAQNIEPATALSEEELSALAQEGINFMGIEIDFIVS